MFHRLLALALLLSACNVAKDASGDDTGADLDGGTGGGVDGLCPALYGTTTASSVREFRVTTAYAEANNFSGTWRASTVDIKGTAITIEVDGNYDGEGYLTESWQTEDTRCDDDGVWVDNVRYAYRYTFDAGATQEGWTDFVYDPPALSFPAAAEVGSTWTTEYSIQSMDNLGNSHPYAYSTENELIAAGTFTVPAGTYPTVEWRTTSSMTPDTPTSQWMSEGPGFVVNDYAELVSYTP